MRRAKRNALLVSETLDIESEDPGPNRWPITADDLEPWFEIDVARRPFVFCFVDEEILRRANDGEYAYAVTWTEPGLVALDRALKDDPVRLAVVLLHELVHVGLGAAVSNGPIVNSIFGAKTSSQETAREESLAAYLSDQLAAPLVAAGLLRLPKFPRGRR